MAAIKKEFRSERLMDQFLFKTRYAKHIFFFEYLGQPTKAEVILIKEDFKQDIQVMIKKNEEFQKGNSTNDFSITKNFKKRHSNRIKRTENKSKRIERRSPKIS